MMSMLENDDKQISMLSEKVGTLTTEVEHLKKAVIFYQKKQQRSKPNVQ